MILREFKEISWNILKKLKQLLKKFCVNFVQVKCDLNLSYFWVNYRENFEVVCKEYCKMLMKYLEKFKEDSKQLEKILCKLSKICRNSGIKNEKNLTRFYRNTSIMTH